MPLSVLFLCTGNSCRSQMAEALLRHRGGPRVSVQSAGSHPAGYIHPLATEAMQRMNVPMETQWSKSWNDVRGIPYDIVITLCDHAACERPPSWVGQPACAHWSLPDPSHVSGTPQQRIDAAMEVARKIEQWVDQLLSLDPSTPRQELEKQVQQIARI